MSPVRPQPGLAAARARSLGPDYVRAMATAGRLSAFLYLARITFRTDANDRPRKASLLVAAVDHTSASDQAQLALRAAVFGALEILEIDVRLDERAYCGVRFVGMFPN